MYPQDIIDLVEKLNYYTKLYDEGHPKISDKEWDDLYFSLIELEKKTGIYHPDSPTQKVNYQVVNELKKVIHSHPMLSLQKTKSIDELNDFIQDRRFILMGKFDGLTCSLRYENGYLVCAETRGNGVEGEDILHNAMVVKSIPKRIECTDTLTIDGEIVCSFKDFEPFKDKYANPRNFAAGSIRLLDSKESAARNLTFIAWDLIDNAYIFETLSDKLRFLSKQGFLTTPFLAANFAKASVDQEDIDFIKDECKEYPIDGLVLKYDACKIYNELGHTDHHFRGGIAYKFYDEVYITKLLDIDWTMGRTGVLTPVAIVEPIEMDGCEVSRASLHNLTIMSEILGHPYVDQKVEIFKANEIIPQIKSAVRPLIGSDYQMIYMPAFCPVCGGILDIECEVNTKVLKCNNPECQGQLVNRLDHFCGKKGLDIKGLSKATLEKLVEWDWVSQPADLYTLCLHRDEWIQKPGFGEKSVDKILDAIEASRHPSLEAFISSLGIPLIGKTISKDLVKYVDSYEDFREKVKSKWDFTKIDGIAYEKASSIWNFDFAEADAIDEYMLSYTIAADLAQPTAKSLQGQIIVITGTLKNFKNRNELQAVIENNGGRVANAISGKTTMLINNDINSNSSKNNAAKKLGIPIITEENFLKDFLTL